VQQQELSSVLHLREPLDAAGQPPVEHLGEQSPARLRVEPPRPAREQWDAGQERQVAAQEQALASPQDARSWLSLPRLLRPRLPLLARPVRGNAYEPVPHARGRANWSASFFP